ncbi:MAG: hypothetical protein PVF27_00940 [Gemmatimonadales bacterium]|jgi:hypothetical protein
MARELGGSQISALLESVPGIVNVLRSPVADALVNMIRAGAGLDDFDLAAAEELIQYAVRRGLIGASEGEEILVEVREVAKKGRKKRRPSRQPARKRSAAKRRAKPSARKAGRKKATKRKKSGPAKRKRAQKAKRKVPKKKKKAAKRSSRAGRAKRR